MLKKLEIINGKLVENNNKKADIYIYTNPDKDELDCLIKKYKIDEHTLSSALDPDENGRLEFEPDHAALILKRPKNYSSYDNFIFKVLSIGIFLYKDKVIIIIPEDIQILEGKQSSKTVNIIDVFLRLLHGTITHFLGHLKVINMISDNIEQKINTSMENKYLLQMFSLEKSLVYYLNGINSNVMLFEKIKMNSNKLGLSKDNMEILEDIIIENNQCRTQAEIYSNILTGLMDARGSIVNNNLNILIKRLTIINIVFMPLNLIAGIGGMSEFSMMTKNISWIISYTFFSLGLVIIAFGTYFIVKRIGQEKRIKVKKPN